MNPFLPATGHSEHGMIAPEVQDPSGRDEEVNMKLKQKVAWHDHNGFCIRTIIGAIWNHRLTYVIKVGHTLYNLPREAFLPCI